MAAAKQVLRTVDDQVAGGYETCLYIRATLDQSILSSLLPASQYRKTLLIDWKCLWLHASVM